MVSLKFSEVQSEVGELLSFQQIQSLTNLNSSTLSNLLARYKDGIRVSYREMEVFYDVQDVMRHLKHLISVP